ncbi:MAG TPA: fumarylacetoacetate hydrolase family protein [Steroidobacteraceae bacterium]|jgi:5-oxopent-3-ene-1,2,5-tricarboxylate decarboxylase/2-hydroxyhepta-2,4-diene-1,7-dioate isomerase|nr:fumarylacetoacetate hydrolase family protein [Steroidobacteraceae bacterium]
MPPIRLSGNVYGTLLNHRSALRALGDQVNKPPYGGAPKAPVLYIKPRNTLAQSGDAVNLPASVGELEIGAQIGIIIGKTTCRVTVDHALGSVAGYLIVNDVSIPHPDYFRPAIRYKALDGFCPIGEAVANRESIDPDALEIVTFVDGLRVQSSNTKDSVRSAAQLIQDVSDFMTLAPGDVLTLGAAAPAPRVRAGQTVRIEVDGLGNLSNRFVAAA